MRGRAPGEWTIPRNLRPLPYPIADPATCRPPPPVERPTSRLVAGRALGLDPVLADRADDDVDDTALIDVVKCGVADALPTDVERGTSRAPRWSIRGAIGESRAVARGVRDPP